MSEDLLTNLAVTGLGLLAIAIALTIFDIAARALRNMR